MLDLSPATGMLTELVTHIGEDQLEAPTAYAFVQSAVAQNPGGSPGLFGPPVTVPETAPLLDRLIGLTGRDPAWQPA